MTALHVGYQSVTYFFGYCFVNLGFVQPLLFLKVLNK